jgi:hypothetical protein
MSAVTKKSRALIPLFAIIGVFLVIGAVLVGSGTLPEEGVREFRLLLIFDATNMKVITEPSVDENTFIYAVNDVAKRGIDIAQGDARIKQLLDESKAKGSCCDYCCRSAHPYG